MGEEFRLRLGKAFPNSGGVARGCGRSRLDGNVSPVRVLSGFEPQCPKLKT
jgi:hypothetical protein